MPKGTPVDPVTRAEVARRLRAGQQLPQVIREMGISRGAVRNARKLLAPELEPDPTTDSKVKINLDLHRLKDGRFVLLVDDPALEWGEHGGRLAIAAADLPTLRSALRAMQDVCAQAGRDLHTTP